MKIGPNEIIKDGLLVYLDPLNSRAYGGSGLLVNDLISNETLTLTNSSVDTNDNLDFNTGYARIPFTEFTGDAVFSVSGWFKLRTTYNTGGPWGFYEGTRSAINAYGFSDNDRIGIDLWGTTTFTTPETYSLTEWKYVTWVKMGAGFTNNTIAIYVDDAEYTGGGLSTRRGGTAQNVTLNGSGGISLGRVGWNSDNYYAKVLISQFKVYDRPISMRDHIHNFNATAHRYQKLNIPKLTTFLQETIDYMGALGIANDNTIYHEKTPQERTGSQLWEIFDNVVRFFKTTNTWDKIDCWFPVFGENTTQLGFDAKNPKTIAQEPTANYLTFLGSWDINSLGLKGNGSNAYATTNHITSVPLDGRGLGIVCVENGVDASLRAELGSASNAANRNFIGTKGSTSTGMGVGFGTTYTLSNNTDGRGVITGIQEATGPSARTFINGIEEQYYNIGSTGLSNIEDYYGCLNESGNTNYFTLKRINSAFWLTGTNQYDVRTISHGIEMWERNLGRKTW
jgi:hypothetical protein